MKGNGLMEIYSELSREATHHLQHGSVVQEVRHDAVAGGLVEQRFASALHIHRLVDEVLCRHFVLQKQLVKHLQHTRSNIPLKNVASNVSNNSPRTTSQSFTRGQLSKKFCTLKLFLTLSA